MVYQHQSYQIKSAFHNQILESYTGSDGDTVEFQYCLSSSDGRPVSGQFRPWKICSQLVYLISRLVGIKFYHRSSSHTIAATIPTSRWVDMRLFTVEHANLPFVGSRLWETITWIHVGTGDIWVHSVYSRQIGSSSESTEELYKYSPTRLGVHHERSCIRQVITY